MYIVYIVYVYILYEYIVRYIFIYPVLNVIKYSVSKTLLEVIFLNIHLKYFFLNSNCVFLIDVQEAFIA